MLLIDALRRLHDRGYAPEFEHPDRAFLEWASRQGGRELITRFQKYFGLPETGELTAEMEVALVAPHCGLTDKLALGGESAWGMTDLAYWQEIVYPGIDPAELAADYSLATQRIEEVCGLTLRQAPSVSAANIVAASGNIDGPWNVLAVSELPPPGNTRLVLNQKFDVAEVGLTRAQRQAMMCHEICHALGLGHAPPGSGALMEPTLGSVVSPQPWDIEQLLARYPLTGPPGSGPPSSAGSGPGPGLAPVPVSGTGSIVTTAQSGAQWTVTLDGPGRYMIFVVPMP